jgi:hypothetical protein
VLDLRDVRYVEGAPFQWRRWLTPGIGVALHLADDGLTVVAPSGQRNTLTWSDVSAVDIRGPDEPDYPSGAPIRLVPKRRILFTPWFRFLHQSEKVKYAWLAIRMTDGTVMIFEVYGLLHDELASLVHAQRGRA